MTPTWPRVVVMGVSGSGKSTIGARVAAELGVPFAEGDDFHGDANRAKMAAGVPLTDEDRWPWLAALRDWAAASEDGCVVACSALRRAYRDVLREAGPDVIFLEVDVPHDVLRARMAARSAHFMPTSLLDSQLATLEPLGADERGVRLDGRRSVDEVVRDALAAVRSSGGPEVR
jgi:carbohydrate kinase (thermoresistant glucokinase family)